MSWLCNRWLLLYCAALFAFEDCAGLFIRHSQTGKCIASSQELVYNYPLHALPYFAVMTANCLDDKAQFRYLDNEILHNIENAGSLFSSRKNIYYKGRWAVYKGVSPRSILSQSSKENRLKQTAAGSLFFYNKTVTVCAEPSLKYVLGKSYCNEAKQDFTFGSVTNYGNKMENVHCSPVQHMIVKSADYGDFNNRGTFNQNAYTDTHCSALTNCLVKSLCDGKRSCELTMDDNLLPSIRCSNTSKQIYTKYICRDRKRQTITVPRIRLLGIYPDRGYVQIKDGSTWRYVSDRKWDKNHQHLLCEHLGFTPESGSVRSGLVLRGAHVAFGDLICYKGNTNRSSCCVNLYPAIATQREMVPYAECKICDRPLLKGSRFPNTVFTGSGGSVYHNVRFSKSGWCASTYGAYLLVDLQKEHQVTHVVIMGNKNQTKWSTSYSMKYSHASNSIDNGRTIQIKGNDNGYKASTTALAAVYNARYIKIQSTGGDMNFCLRLELCGKAQTPAPVYDIRITPYQYTARVTWKIRRAQEESSYITNIIICFNGTKCQNKSRGTEAILGILKPDTSYNVEIATQDGSFQNSTTISKVFKTRVSGVRGPPLNVTLKTRDKNSLDVSWNVPEKDSQNSELTGYQVCFYTKDKRPECLALNSTKVFSLTLDNLLPSTKYFVTVSASTKAGYGERSLEVSQITNGDTVNVFAASFYTLSLNIPKPENYIREVMIIVQDVKTGQAANENSKTSELKPYESNTQDPYIAAFLKTDVLPLTFFIGDGREYNSERENYFNQPLKKSSKYIVFLRFFENKESYYSTEWSSPVQTMSECPVYLSNCEESGQPSEAKNTRLDLLIPLVILALCFVLLLPVMILHQYRRRFKDSTPKISNCNKPMQGESHIKQDSSENNDIPVYETPDDVKEYIHQNEATSKPETSTQESSAYMTLKDNKEREPDNAYQSLQNLSANADPRYVNAGRGDQTMQYEMQSEI